MILYYIILYYILYIILYYIILYYIILYHIISYILYYIILYYIILYYMVLTLDSSTLVYFVSVCNFLYLYFFNMTIASIHVLCLVQNFLDGI